MKTRNLFLSLFAFAALCACNKENPEGPQVLEADTYIKVNIMATGASTKAFEYGDDTENEVKNALFLFFDASGNAVTNAKPTLTFGAANATGQNVAKSATIKLPAKKTKPSQMLVILNYANESDYTGKPLSSVKALLAGKFVNEISSVDYFVMTNSVYTDDASNAKTDEDVICAVQLTDDNFGTTDTEDELVDATPVNVYVERVAAKVTLTKKGGGITVTPTTKEVVVLNSSSEFEVVEITLTPDILGYTVIEDASDSYMFKTVDPAWDYVGWTDPTNFRSYWAESLSTATYSHYTVAEINAEPTTLYVHENTSSDEETTTKVILAAQLKDGSSAPVELVEYNGTYYKMDAFKKLVVETVNASLAIPIAEGDLEVAHVTANDYEMKFTVVGNDDANAILETMVAKYWNQGYCYYFTEIMHDSPAVAGVVRNHVYQLTLNSLKGLGVSIPVPTTPIDPEKPVDEYYSLNATVNILQWKVVTQEVDFDM